LGSLVFLVILFVIIWFVVKSRQGTNPLFRPGMTGAQLMAQFAGGNLAALAAHAGRPRHAADAVAALDPTFSEPVFLEWVTLLYTRAQQGRGKDRSALAPWFANVDEALPAVMGGLPVKDVRGVVVGSIKLGGLQQSPQGLRLGVTIQACVTVNHGSREQAYYVHERWTLMRALGVTSRAPDDVEKMGCPTCGSAVERTAQGRCASCGNELTPGKRDWGVEKVEVLEMETRPPLLEGSVEEVGTDLPTVFSPTLAGEMAALKLDPTFDAQRFQTRARTIFMTLQEGWTSQQWEKLRPYETENVFQQHRFWMEEYKKKGLRNVLANVRLTRVEVVNVQKDAHYQAITCRMHAAMRDSTVRVSTGKVVGGDAGRDRVFTEYWTFLRRPGAQTKGQDANCPSCGAPLKVSQAGVCEYCNSKITRGQFDWVLSRIEQDEEYTG